MEESQRESMYNGWAKDKIFLTVKKEVFEDKAICSVEFQKTIHSEEFLKSDCIGDAKPFNVAFSLLQTKMKSIDKNIELKYPI